MLSRAWLTIAQHVFQPALAGRPELISWFRGKLSSANRDQRLSRWADFAKNCLPRIGSKVLPRFREKYRALGRPKNGVQHATAIYPIPRYTRPQYIGLTLYKPENGTCWMRTVLAEWGRYLQSVFGWNASDLSYFSIPVWNTTRAYHLRNSVCTCDPWDVHNAIRTCGQAKYFYGTPAWIVPEPTVYLSSQEASAGLR